MDFQRKNTISNAHIGKEFEEIALTIFKSKGINLTLNHPVDIGINANKKSHKFDLGSNNPKIIVECKSHKWTSGNNVPSAKITVWNEAMYYFSMSSPEYRKIFFVLRDVRSSTNETLAKYYTRLHKHMIPNDVEIWEYDPLKNNATIIN